MKVILRTLSLIVMVAAFALPAMAQQHEWQSTSTLQGTGSSYSSQVTAVGATGVSDMATTTESYSPAMGPRRVKMDDFNQTSDPNKENADGGSPLGDALVPLMLCAGAYLIIRARKRASKGERANG